MTDAASPADKRCGLDPAAVGALADQLHVMRCAPVGGTATFAAGHRADDLSRARFLLLGLGESGWTVSRETPAEPICCGEPMIRNRFTGLYECAEAFLRLLDDGVLGGVPELSDTEAMNDYQRGRFEHWKATRVPADEAPRGVRPQKERST